MIALDTNVVVRFLTQDDSGQSARANAVFSRLTEAHPGFLCREVVVELVWVLERAYGLPRERIAAALDGLLAARELIVESPDRTGLAVERYRAGGAGFSDHMIALAGREAGCRATFSSSGRKVLSARLVTSAGSSSNRRVRSSGAISLSTLTSCSELSALTRSAC